MVGHDCHAHLPAPGCITMSVWHAGSRKTQLGASQRGGAGRQHALAVHGGVAGAQRGPRMPAAARPALAPLAVGLRAALAAGGAAARGRRCVGVRHRDGGRVRRGHGRIRGACGRHGRRGGRRHGGGRWRPDRLGRSRGDAAAGHAAELKALWHLHTSSRGVRQHGRGLARVGCSVWAAWPEGPGPPHIPQGAGEAASCRQGAQNGACREHGAGTRRAHTRPGTHTPRGARVCRSHSENAPMCSTAPAARPASGCSSAHVRASRPQRPLHGWHSSDCASLASAGRAAASARTPRPPGRAPVRAPSQASGSPACLHFPCSAWHPLCSTRSAALSRSRRLPRGTQRGARGAPRCDATPGAGAAGP